MSIKHLSVIQKWSGYFCYEQRRLHSLTINYFTERVKAKVPTNQERTPPSIPNM